MSQEITLYSATMCGDCQLWKAFMDAEGSDYTLRDIRENLEYGEELEKKTGKLGVPYLVIDGEGIRGYDVGKAFTEDFAKALFA